MREHSSSRQCAHRSARRFGLSQRHLWSPLQRKCTRRRTRTGGEIGVSRRGLSNRSAPNAARPWTKSAAVRPSQSVSGRMHRRCERRPCRHFRHQILPHLGPHSRKFTVNIIITRLLVTPISWLLAVPIVMLDRVLAPDLPELSHPIAARRPCAHANSVSHVKSFLKQVMAAASWRKPAKCSAYRS